MNIKITRKEPAPFILANIMPVLKNSNGSKDLYNILNKVNDIPTGQASWKKYNITNGQWKQIYIFPVSITTYPALRWFQISIKHNILVTNRLLYQVKIYDSALCTFCRTTIESIVHLFWKCDKTQQFIKSVINWLSSFNIQCDISETYFLFGLQEEHRFTNVLNFILLLYTKYYIYLARCKKQNLIINVFKQKLKVMFKVHKEIAFTHQEENYFQNKWNPSLSLINDIV